MGRSRRLFTSESVTESHPDKMANQISDATHDYETCAVLSSIHGQSPDIARGVDPGGAGDQERSLPQILPVFSVVAPCHAGASPVSMRRLTFTTDC